jgi:hypothetical protein
LCPGEVWLACAGARVALVCVWSVRERERERESGEGERERDGEREKERERERGGKKEGGSNRRMGDNLE